MLCKIVGGTKVPGNEKSWNKSSSGRKVQGTKVPFRSQGTKVPGNEKSRERKFPIGTIRSWERKVLGTKSPGTYLETWYNHCKFCENHARDIDQFSVKKVSVLGVLYPYCYTDFGEIWH